MVLYLHGFASGPSSSKATYIGQRLRERGIPCETPDLNLPDFSTLTITRMIDQASAIIDKAAGPVTIVGSSLGGFVAVNMAVRRPADVASLVLLAPALDFGALAGSGVETNRDGGVAPLGDRGIDKWRRTGVTNVFHYGYGRFMPVHYDLYEDARRYDAMHAHLTMPVVVFQGTRDDTVDPVSVEAWSRRRPNVELHLVDDGHQLSASLPEIWRRLEQLVNW